MSPGAAYHRSGAGFLAAQHDTAFFLHHGFHTLFIPVDHDGIAGFDNGVFTGRAFVLAIAAFDSEDDNQHAEPHFIRQQGPWLMEDVTDQEGRREEQRAQRTKT